MTTTTDKSKEMIELEDLNYNLQAIRSAAMWKLEREEEMKVLKSRKV